MNNDGVIYNKKFNLVENIDEQLLDPNKKIKFGDGEYSLREIRNLIPSKEKKVRLFIEWDNMCQYTALGLLSKLNEITGEKRTIDIAKFVRRENYPNGIDYVKYEIYKDADPKLIDSVITKYYPEILLKSPITNFLAQINFLSFMTESITFMFRYHHPKLDELIEDISHNKLMDRVYCNKTYLPDEFCEEKYIKATSTYDFYLVPDMGLYYQTLINEGKHNTSIMGYRDHNGISKEILALYINAFYKDNLPGPNNIFLNFLDEYRPNQEDKEKWENEDRFAKL